MARTLVVVMLSAPYDALLTPALGRARCGPARSTASAPIPGTTTSARARSRRTPRSSTSPGSRRLAAPVPRRGRDADRRAAHRATRAGGRAPGARGRAGGPLPWAAGATGGPGVAAISRPSTAPIDRGITPSRSAVDVPWHGDKGPRAARPRPRWRTPSAADPLDGFRTGGSARREPDDPGAGASRRARVSTIGGE